VSEASC